MCRHPTHAQFTCGHYLVLPQVGRHHQPPQYCELVKAKLDWYHTQPDRQPEPIPVPSPNACPIVYGLRPGEGNTTVVAQLHPCGDCIKNFALGGINAREAQLEQQEALHPTPKRKGKKSKLRGGNKKSVWREIQGDRWCGVQRVRESSLESARPSPFSRDELGVISEMETKLSPDRPLTVEQTYLTPHPVALTVGGPVPFPTDPTSKVALEQFAFIDEAGRRGMQMKMDHTNKCLELPQGKNVPIDASIVPDGIATYNSPPQMVYGPQPPLMSIGIPFYTPQPVIMISAGQPVFLPDGTVELPDEWDSCREAHVVPASLKPAIKVDTARSSSDPSDGTDGTTHESSPHQDRPTTAAGDEATNAIPRVVDMLDQERRRLSLVSLGNFEAELSPKATKTVKTARCASASAAPGAW